MKTRNAAAAGEAGAAATAVLSDHGAERVREGHPWVYAGDILGWEPKPPAEQRTAPVSVRDRRGRGLGVADFSPHSKIRLRLLSREPGVNPDRAFMRERIARAITYRQRLVSDSDAYRVVAAEADGMPGLIVDRYGEALTVQTLTWAMAARQVEILELLDEQLRPTVVVERNETRVREREGLELRSGLLRGAQAQVEARINGLRFGVDLLEGQKTGGFLDQRENWAAAARMAASLQVRTALDVFTYQGGFALHLARSGTRVEGVDSSRPALEAADRNAAVNRLPAIEWIEANAFELLRDYDQAERQFEAVVLDPPAFAKTRGSVAQAAAGYKEINLRALKILRPGGLLVTCSCSHHLSETHFLQVIAAAAADARRELVILERRGQALDHPVLLAAPETRYLKCVLAMVR